MNGLLVVTSQGGQLVGVLADTRRDEDGTAVFYRDGVEVARSRPGDPVMVRDTTRRPGTGARATLRSRTLTAAAG